MYFDYKCLYIEEELDIESSVDCVFYEWYSVKVSVYVHLLFVHVNFFQSVNVAVFVPVHQRTQIVEHVFHDFGADLLQTVVHFELVVVEHARHVVVEWQTELCEFFVTEPQYFFVLQIFTQMENIYSDKPQIGDFFILSLLVYYSVAFVNHHFQKYIDLVDFGFVCFM